MSKRSARRNAARGRSPANGNGNGGVTFRERLPLLSGEDLGRLLKLGANILLDHQVEVLANTARANAPAVGQHPTEIAVVAGAGVVADMVLRCLDQHAAPPKQGEAMPPLVAALVRMLQAAQHQLAEQQAKQAEGQCGRPVEEGEDIVMRARKSGIVIAH